jgi:putative flippase GtrA
MSISTQLFSMFRQNRKEVTRFAKFATVGAIGSVVDFSFLNLAHKLFPWPVFLGGQISFVTGWPLLAANTLSFTLSVLSNFTWNRLWTFPESRCRPVHQQLGQFAVVNIVGLAINNVILLVAKGILSGFIGDPWDYNLAKAIAIGIVLFWNFSANRLWTYRGL